MRIAAIDIGTNSVHMIVVRVRPDLSFEVVDREKVMVRLGAGGLDGKALTTEGMTAALQALSKFRRLAESHGVDKVLAAATSATREARNGGEFLARIERETGIRARVIAGVEEARLIHLAAVYGVDVGNGRGTWFLPEVGDEVLVAFEGSRIEHPFVLGALWNGQDLPPERNADGKNDLRVIHSRSGHRIVFDDGAQGRIEIHLKDRSRTVRIDPDGIAIKDDAGNEITIESLPGNITLKSQVGVSIESTTVDIKAQASMTLQASGTLTIKGGLVLIN